MKFYINTTNYTSIYCVDKYDGNDEEYNNHGDEFREYIRGKKYSTFKNRTFTGWFRNSIAHQEITNKEFNSLLISWGFEKHTIDISLKSKIIRAF